MSENEPIFKIVYINEESLGRCYTAYHYELQRRRLPLTDGQIVEICALGLTMCGQEFYIRSRAKEANEKGYFVYRVESRIDSSD